LNRVGLENAADVRIPAKSVSVTWKNQFSFVSIEKIPAVRPELWLDSVDETSGSIDANSLFSPKKESQQLVEACKVVHMPMCDKDITDTQELARSKPVKVAGSKSSARRSNTRST